MKYSIIYLSIVSTLMLTGCGAGDAPYDEVAKDPDMITSKSISNLKNKQFIYMRSLGDAPRYASSIAGFSPGPAKIVTLNLTAAGIQVLQIDRDNIGLGDTRFDNPINRAPVVTIPGEYVDFKCTTDAYGHCTNSEEESRDPGISWENKKYFVPDFASFKLAAMSADDTDLRRCTTESVKPELLKNGGNKGYEMNLDEGVINIAVKHTYSASLSCLGEYYHGDLDNMSFTTTEYISIVALDKVASPDYEPVINTVYSSQKFGAFATDHSVRDATYISGLDGNTVSYLNRWNPKKGSITYYLSNNYYEKHNAHYLDATIAAVKIINVENRWAHTGLPTIKVEQAHDHSYGDVRYSFITLFDEPLDNGLLGYGPSAHNPLTGEIVSGRVNQYAGNSLGESKTLYENLRQNWIHGRLDQELINNKIPGAQYKTATAQIEEAKNVGANKQYSFSNHPQKALFHGELGNVQNFPNNFHDVNTFNPASEKLGELSIKELRNKELISANFKAKHNMYSESSGTGKSLNQLPTGVLGFKIVWTNTDFWIDGIVGKELQKWVDIPMKSREVLAKKIAVQNYMETLTHELGHTIGLGHNFEGSSDKANFWGNEEIASLDAEIYKVVPDKDISVRAKTASVMDYNADTTRFTLGKYDLAVLRYLYKREVMDQNGDMHSLTKGIHSLKTEDAKVLADLRKGILPSASFIGPLETIANQIAKQNPLREFKYCTDAQHVNSNTCNMFDEGTDPEEIVKDYIQRYDETYNRLHTRSGKANFSEFSSMNNVIRTYGQFSQIHSFIEGMNGLEELVGEKKAFDMSLTKANAPAFSMFRARTAAADFFFEKVGAPADTIISVRMAEIGKSTPPQTPVYLLSNILKGYIFYKEDMSVDFKQGTPIMLSMVGSAPTAKIHVDYSINKNALESLVNNVINTNNAKNFNVNLLVAAGKPLNGRAAPNTVSTHPYSGERDVLGSWPEKLFAMRMLVTHESDINGSSLASQAIVDLPSRIELIDENGAKTGKVGAYSDIFTGMLCRMTMSTQPLIKGTTDANTNKLADLLKDPCQLMFSPVMPTVDKKYLKLGFLQILDYANLEIEGLPASYKGVANVFGFSTDQYGAPKGKSNLLKMMLRQIKMTSFSTDDSNSAIDNAKKWQDLIALTAVDTQMQKSVLFNNQYYVAGDENTLGAALIYSNKNITDILDDMKLLTGSIVLPWMGNNSDANKIILNNALERNTRVLHYLSEEYDRETGEFN